MDINTIRAWLGHVSIDTTTIYAETDLEMKAKASTIGLLPIDPPSIADTEKYLASEREKWGSLVKKLGLEGSQ